MSKELEISASAMKTATRTGKNKMIDTVCERLIEQIKDCANHGLYYLILSSGSSIFIVDDYKVFKLVFAEVVQRLNALGYSVKLDSEYIRSPHQLDFNILPSMVDKHTISIDW